MTNCTTQDGAKLGNLDALREVVLKHQTEVFALHQTSDLLSERRAQSGIRYARNQVINSRHLRKCISEVESTSPGRTSLTPTLALRTRNNDGRERVPESGVEFTALWRCSVIASCRLWSSWWVLHGEFVIFGRTSPGTCRGRERPGQQARLLR